MLNSLKRALESVVGTRKAAVGPPSGADTCFVIFGQGRTGSSLLRSLLNSHPAVRCEGEVLADPVDHPVAFVDELAASSTKPVFGFKVKIYQLTEAQQTDPAEFLQHLRSRSYQIIYIRRNNLLRHAISNEFAEARSSYHDRSDGPRPSLTIDPQKLIGVMERRQAHLDNEAAILADFAHTRVDYESDLLDPSQHQPTADRIFATLGLESVPVGTDLARSVSGSLADRIANYDDLVAALRDTEFSRFLTDPAYG